MSTDYDYILSWECLPYADGDPVLCAIKSINDADYWGNIICLPSTLYFSCVKYGITWDNVKFVIPPDQIFERANTSLWVPCDQWKNA